jgi:hypothetical protein
MGRHNKFTPNLASMLPLIFKCHAIPTRVRLYTPKIEENDGQRPEASVSCKTSKRMFKRRLICGATEKPGSRTNHGPAAEAEES